MTNKEDRSLMDKDRVGGGREKRDRWPLSLDTRDPEGIADFTLGLGYSQENVVTTLIRRCNLDPFTAKRIVADVAQQQGGSQ